MGQSDPAKMLSICDALGKFYVWKLMLMCFLYFWPHCWATFCVTCYTCDALVWSITFCCSMMTKCSLTKVIKIILLAIDESWILLLLSSLMEKYVEFLKSYKAHKRQLIAVATRKPSLNMFKKFQKVSKFIQLKQPIINIHFVKLL